MKPRSLLRYKLGASGARGWMCWPKSPPDPANPILKLENVLFTPHTAGVTSSTWQRRGARLYTKFAAGGRWGEATGCDRVSRTVSPACEGEIPCSASHPAHTGATKTLAGAPTAHRYLPHHAHGLQLGGAPLGRKPLPQSQIRITIPLPGDAASFGRPTAELVAAAHPDGPDDVHVQIHPDYRHLEEEIFAWAEEHLGRTNGRRPAGTDHIHLQLRYPAPESAGPPGLRKNRRLRRHPAHASGPAASFSLRPPWPTATPCAQRRPPTSPTARRSPTCSTPPSAGTFTPRSNSRPSPTHAPATGPT